MMDPDFLELLVVWCAVMIMLIMACAVIYTLYTALVSFVGAMIRHRRTRKLIRTLRADDEKHEDEVIRRVR